jgi:hypothetical protein
MAERIVDAPNERYTQAPSHAAFYEGYDRRPCHVLRNLGERDLSDTIVEKSGGVYPAFTIPRMERQYAGVVEPCRTDSGQ